MLKKLFDRSEIGFALLWIGIYVVGMSVCDSISDSLGHEQLVNLPFLIVMLIPLLMFVRRHGLNVYYGLCRTDKPASVFLFYVPMFLIFSVNLWFGAAINEALGYSCLYIVCHLVIGLTEELLFRGLLFKAMAKTNLKSAIIVSSVTFGVGHITNFINGNAPLFQTALQMCYATAIGFLFVVILWKGGSMIPCIIAHGVNNALSIFANRAAFTPNAEAAASAILCVLCILYALFIIHKCDRLPKAA